MNYGRYQIIKELGKGSMGVVYQAHDPNLDILLALKVLRQDRVSSEAFVKRFLREARVLGRLNHPNIVRVYNVDEDQGTVYIAMEFVEGEPLSDVLAGKALTVGEIAELGIVVAETLDYAHEKGIVHRDIKPSNIMLKPNGQLKITDLGIAHIEDPSAHQQTQAGEILGTPAYMAPEQVLGRPVDGRSDIFSLGVILYELSTGKRPFAGDNLAAIFRAITQDDPPEPASINPAIPPELSRAIMICLRKTPDERFARGTALAEALRSAVQEKVAQLPATEKRQPGRRVSLWFAVLALIAILGSGLYWVPKWRSGELPADGKTTLAPGSPAAPQPPKMASLALGSLPDAAQVFVDEAPKGKTPLKLELPLGNHKLRMSLADHQDYEEQLQLAEARDYPLTVTLKPIIKPALLKVDSLPLAAQVFVDGTFTGKTPLRLELPAGKHEVRVTYSDHYEWEAQVNLKEEAETPLLARLIPIEPKKP